MYSSSELLDKSKNSNNEYNEQLRNRINQLRDTMQDLKAQLKDEKDNWEKEIQQLNNPENNQVQIDVTPSNNDLSTSTLINTGLPVYEAPMDYIHVESKNLQRQLAISNYRRRLLEVENMCNLELMRVKQNVTFLQPLRMMANEWESAKTPDECGESLYPNHKSGDFQLSENVKLQELSTPLEIMSNKFAGDTNTFSKNESNEISSFTKLNYQNEGNGFNSRSSAWGGEYITTE